MSDLDLPVLRASAGARSSQERTNGQFAVQASSSVIVDLDGRIVRRVPDDRGPWTNGEVRSPTPRGRALPARCPGVTPNVYRVALEAEGFSAGEHPEAQLRSIAWMCRAWMTRHGLAIEDPGISSSSATISRAIATYSERRSLSLCPARSPGPRRALMRRVACRSSSRPGCVPRRESNKAR
ncbi:MAG: N-acetylmuramoyl-L-alanine amidase [Chloroflexota bacterium]